MAYDPAMDRIAALFGVGGPLGGLVGPSYNPMMLDPSYPSGMIPPNPNDPSLLQAPPNLDALDGQVSGFSRGPLQVNPGAGLSLPGNPPPARPPAFADMQAMTPPLPLPRPESSMIPMGSAPPAAGMPGGGPNPIMAGSRVLPFTPEQAAAARSIGVPGGMPDEGPSPAPGPSAPQMSAGPVGGLGGGPNGMGGLGGFFGGDFGDKLQDAFLGLAMGSTPNESIARAAQMIAQGRERRALEGDVNRTRELAVSLGIPAEVASSLPAKELLPMIRKIQLDRMEGGKTRYHNVGGALYNESTGEWLTPPKDAAGGDFGLNPVYGTDKDGNPILLQIGKDGKAVQTVLPEGVQISPGVEKVDAGTHWLFYDKRTGQKLDTVPKDVEGEKAAEARGKAVGEAQAELPASLGKAQIALDTIDAIRKHPGKSWGVGATSIIGAIPATDAYGFARLVDQAKGQAFLEAFESLKGGGQITEAEGQKATEAIARLDRAQKPADFEKALDDLEQVIRAGMERSQQRAGRVPSAPVPAAPPNVRVIDGVKIWEAP